ncbi:MAG: hypothetical protein KDI19_01645 [Pseudomonadales bacterium]|nr:hypothetical protein [Pseudomonadales bacterium]
MTKLAFTKEELEAEHDYATPHIECGLKLHGGFDEAGNYLTPRTRHRWDAINAWTQQLVDRGVPILDATTELLTEPNYPTIDQQIFLLQHGIEQPLWDSLTITGLIEARGKALADLVPPDFQNIIIEDISEMALGHLGKGLLTSHGWDEGGNPATDLGGHDVMWFAARDLVFGKDKFPIPTPPASIGREKDQREMEQIPMEYEGVLAFLMNLLMIEVRAERGFDFNVKVLSNPAVFTDRRKEAEHAAQLVNRIRQDEAVHVAWLKAAISEFRSCTIRTVDGKEVSGATIIDPVWEKMVHWHAVEMHVANRDNNRAELRRKILATPNGATVMTDFEKLAA